MFKLSDFAAFAPSLICFFTCDCSAVAATLLAAFGKGEDTWDGGVRYTFRKQSNGEVFTLTLTRGEWRIGGYDGQDIAAFLAYLNDNGIVGTEGRHPMTLSPVCR